MKLNRQSHSSSRLFHGNAALAVLILLLAMQIMGQIFMQNGPAEAVLIPGEQDQAEKQLDLNRAGLHELGRLPGIGPAKARNIIDYRKQHGFFTSLEDLKSVKGLGVKTIKSIRKQINRSFKTSAELAGST